VLRPSLTRCEGTGGRIFLRITGEVFWVLECPVTSYIASYGKLNTPDPIRGLGLPIYYRLDMPSMLSLTTQRRRTVELDITCPSRATSHDCRALLHIHSSAYMESWQPTRQLFRLACLGMVVTACAHLQENSAQGHVIWNGRTITQNANPKSNCDSHQRRVSLSELSELLRRSEKSIQC